MIPSVNNEILRVPDDAWDILRDCRVFFLKQLVRLLQEAEPLPEEPLSAFARATGAYFDDMVSTEKRSRFDQLGSLTASRISLLGEDDLELDIRLGSFVSQLLEANAKELWRVYLRFVTLLGRPDLSPGDNPVGPRAVATGLVALCKALDDNHDRALNRVTRLEEHFAEFLPAVYLALNDFLVSRKVSAAQPTLVTAPDVVDHAAAPGGSGLPPGALALDPAVALQMSLLGQQSVGQQPSGQAAWARAAASLVTQAMFGRLLARLDDLERAGHPASEGKAGTPRPLSATELGVPTGVPEAAAIDALAMIFEAIFDSPTLPDAVKSALGSLQIPTLRAAMLDSGFFTADAHPARQLLDKMARAAVGLPADVSSRHPLCAGVQKVAARVRSEFVRDTQVLSQQVAELDKLISERDTLAAQAASAYRPLLQRMEQSDLAELRSHQAVDRFCMTSGMPPRIADFLRDHWQRVLRQVWIESGEDGPEWQECTAVLDKLLWSIQPKVDIEARRQLARQLPQMLQAFTGGMQRVSVPETARAEFLDTCFALQTAAMRGGALAVRAAGEIRDASPQAVGVRPAAGAVPVSSELRVGAQVLRIFDLGGGARRGRSRQSPAHTGDWLTFRLADDLALCGRVCHIGKATGKLLLANPDWGFGVVLHPAIAESQLRDGRASISSRSSLFNTAAEQALRRRSGSTEVPQG